MDASMGVWISKKLVWVSDITRFVMALWRKYRHLIKMDEDHLIMGYFDNFDNEFLNKY
jgi:hypothetical protein